jgi:hypothetical protein
LIFGGTSFASPNLTIQHASIKFGTSVRNSRFVVAKPVLIVGTDTRFLIFAGEKTALLAKLGGGLQKIGAFKFDKFITTDGFKFLQPNNEWLRFAPAGPNL